MLKHSHALRVRYAETDQMGYAYYGRYAEYFEVARAELVRQLGTPYCEMEAQHGVMLPVRELWVEYHKAARYDELITVHTEIRAWPTVRLEFHHKVVNEAGQQLCLGRVVLVFVDARTMRPTRPPRYFLEQLGKHWQGPLPAQLL
jgi:acyl-CoA thioester hydrolase